MWVRTKHKCKLINIHNWELAKLERAEALAVLHEILKECKESVTMNGVSLETPSISSLRGYQIKINCTLDIASKQCIEPILNKHKLLLKETEGFVIIQSI